MIHAILPDYGHDFLARMLTRSDDLVDETTWLHLEDMIGAKSPVSYTQAMDDLRLWRQINLWSMSPVAVPSHTTTEAIALTQERIEIDKQFRKTLAMMVATRANISAEQAEDYLMHGWPEQFCDVMRQLEKDHRLDREKA